MAARITVVFDAHDGCYGAKRVTTELNDLGDPGAAQAPSSPESPVVDRKRVARLMKANGLAGFTRRRRVKTTVADASRRVFADLVNRRFTAKSVNQVYVGDITYLPVSDGSNMYLATVVDCFSRRLVGFASQRPHAHQSGRRRTDLGDRSARKPGVAVRRTTRTPSRSF